MSVKEIAKKEPTSVIARAFKFADEAHAGQKRKTGEPYFNHALSTAEILNGWRLDETTIAAGLLHDTAEDTKTSLEMIKKEFGDDIAFLVDGVTKLGHIKYREAATKAENIRKMILALSQDLRVVLIKLADRLHNMRTLGALPQTKQKRIALETDEIYAPLAYRLGMQHLSGELKDLAFPYLHPQENDWLKKTVSEKYKERLTYLKKIKPDIEKALKENHIVPAIIDFRAKRWSSLYQKLLRYDMDVEKIYDLVAMRIIVQTVAECYAALGVIHYMWPPLPGRIKDYIAMPKPNGYRSLHTTVIGPDEKIVEFQIRTQEMHEEAENGIAAHWIYEQSGKEERKETFFKKLVEEIQWVKQLRNWQEKYFGKETDSKKFLEAMKIDFFKDRIFAITPRGDVIDLPAGVTPVDFAYQIHSKVGDACVGAKVNNQIIPLNFKLRSGDMVEILTQKNKKPSEDWLKFVKTTLARDHIKSALRQKSGVLKSTRGPAKTELRIVSQGRIGLIKDISSLIARSHINILAFHTQNPRGGRFSISKVECAIGDKQKIERLILKLKKLGGVKEVSYRLV